MEIKSADENTKPQQQHFHVLAVDDSLIERKLLEKLLRVSSCQVTCVDSGDKALEYLGLLENASSVSSFSSESTKEGMKVNLIMTDYCMPGMSGYDLLKRVKDSSWKDIPVVIMSSENIPSRISMCLEEGAEEFLLKPLQLSDVEKLQCNLLRSKHHSLEEEINNNGSIIINNNNNKRKAISPGPSERRPKMKELAVL